MQKKIESIRNKLKNFEIQIIKAKSDVEWYMKELKDDYNIATTRNGENRLKKLNTLKRTTSEKLNLLTDEVVKELLKYE